MEADGAGNPRPRSGAANGSEPAGGGGRAHDGGARTEAVRRYLEVLDAAVAPALGADVEALEAAFIEAAGPYSRREGISYEAWLAVGVETWVLDAAGIRPRR